MLNIEKYKDELIEMGVINIMSLAKVNNKLTNCVRAGCSECDFSTRKCGEKTKEWLFSEYKEPEVDWSKVKVDTPILVRKYENEEWNKRYFAKFEYGVVWSFCDGRTSWSARKNNTIRNDTISWKYAKLAESEETVWQRSELQKN